MGVGQLGRILIDATCTSKMGRYIYWTAGNFWGRKLLWILRFCGYSWKFSLRNLGAWSSNPQKCENLISTNSWQFSPTKVSHYTVPLNWVYISVLPGRQQTWGGRSWGLLRERGWRWVGHRSGNLGRSWEGWRVVVQCTCGGACSWQSPVLRAPPEK